MEVFLRNKTLFKIEKKLLKKVFNEVLRITGINTKKNISVVIVNNKEIKKLNQLYRKKDKETDVLSFSFLEDEKCFKGAKDAVMGEIIISGDQAKKQAKEKKHIFSKEITILFIHGLLHILGYDHKWKKETVKMQGLEKRACTDIFNTY